jgi:hypothetical protein
MSTTGTARNLERFTVDIDQYLLDDLRARLTRWPWLVRSRSAAVPRRRPRAGPGLRRWQVLSKFMEIFCWFLVTWIGWGQAPGTCRRGRPAATAPPEKRCW